MVKCNNAHKKLKQKRTVNNVAYICVCIYLKNIQGFYNNFSGNTILIFKTNLIVKNKFFPILEIFYHFQIIFF